MSGSQVQIRLVLWGRDLAAMAKLDRAIFSRAWSEKQFIKIRERSVGLVAIDQHFARIGLPNRELVGYTFYQHGKGRINLLRLGVDQDRRHEGIGSQLIERVKGKLRTHRCKVITLVIRETNLPGQLFLKYHGFKALRVLREFYSDTGEDAYYMQFRPEIIE